MVAPSAAQESNWGVDLERDRRTTSLNLGRYWGDSKALVMGLPVRPVAPARATTGREVIVGLLCFKLM